jgi:hypothetical protein
MVRAVPTSPVVGDIYSIINDLVPFGLQPTSEAAIPPLINQLWKWSIMS